MCVNIESKRISQCFFKYNTYFISHFYYFIYPEKVFHLSFSLFSLFNQIFHSQLAPNRMILARLSAKYRLRMRRQAETAHLWFLYII